MSISIPALLAELNPKHGILTGGRGFGAGTFPVHDPASAEVLAEVADGTAAADAAAAAFPGLAATPA